MKNIAFSVFLFSVLLSCGEVSQEAGSGFAYNPQISPLPSRTPRPLEEWGVDNGETIISHTFFCVL
jgi:hypothetical protein